VLLTGGLAQTRPDFSGRWVDAASRLTMVVEHTADELQFEAIHDGQSAGRTVVPLDGSEHTAPAESPEAQRWVSRATWEKDDLVIVATAGPAGDGPSSVRQTWSREGDALTITMVHLNEAGETLRRSTTTLTRE
jgi:hypothetical protein